MKSNRGGNREVDVGEEGEVLLFGYMGLGVEFIQKFRKLW